MSLLLGWTGLGAAVDFAERLTWVASLALAMLAGLVVRCGLTALFAGSSWVTRAVGAALGIGEGASVAKAGSSVAG